MNESPDILTRRRLLGMAGLAGLGAALPAPLTAETAPSRSPKKGLGIAAKGDGWARRLAALHCSWFYNWGSKRPQATPPGVAHVPMIFSYWGQDQAIAETGRRARAAGVKELLGFNEPEKKDQGNLSIERALKAWPLLEQTGLRLGSPGCVHPDREWMTGFMEEVEKRGLRVDFVCVHSYGGPNAKALVERLKKVHRMFRRPIWITEFAVGDWDAESAAQNKHRPARVLKFMEEILPALEKLDFVERYAWFPATPDNRALGTSALFDASGQLTPLGKFYRDFQG